MESGADERPTTPIEVHEVGSARVRVDGRAKVTGEAVYAVEHPAAQDALHLWLVQSSIAKGRVVTVDPSAALGHPGVVAVLDHTNAPRLEPGDEPNGELLILQDVRVGFRGQIVAVVAAESSEAAREGAALVEVEYAAGCFSYCRGDL